MKLKDRLAFGLDVPAVLAGEQISKMAGNVGWIKTNSVFVGGGHQIIDSIADTGTKIFLDLKWFDIPHTLENYAEAVEFLRGVRMVNLHSLGTSKMMKACVQRMNAIFEDDMDEKPLVIAVTVLTSMTKDDLKEIGINATPAEQVLRLARLAIDSGCDGVVASPQEATMLRKEFGDGFLIITPAIRFEEEATDDQARAGTPQNAIASGADIIVMGRSLLRGGIQAVQRAYREIEQGLLKK